MREDEFIGVRHITKDGMVYKTIERSSFLKVMEGLNEIFIYNNEISKKFIEIIPKLEEIEINEVRNLDCDTPFVMCHLDNGDFEVIRISRNHTIIWKILNEYTK